MMDPQVIQQGKDREPADQGGGDQDNNNRGSGGTTFSFDQVRESGGKVLAFIAQNTATIVNVLNSDIQQYNFNVVQGATLYHLLLQLQAQLDALWTTFDQQFGNIDPTYDLLHRPASEEESVRGALEEALADAAIDANEEAISQEYNQISQQYLQAQGTLMELINFFEPYADFVSANPALAHQANAQIHQGILPQNVPVIYPGQGTVQQIMQAQDYATRLALAKATGRRVLHPGGDPFGGDRSGI